MDLPRLANLIERPEVHRTILGDYEGGYSLGLTLNPEDHNELVIRVRIEGEDDSRIPSKIVLEGETIPIIVNKKFKVPKPLTLA
ncbi:MAG: hypothetical protein M3430_06195 [Acidobacteriota bacterium]|nr:hypothetical protein [Acidobacteriota bacterium]